VQDLQCSSAVSARPGAVGLPLHSLGARHATEARVPLSRGVDVVGQESAGAEAISRSPDFAARQLGLLPMLADAPRDFTEGMMRNVISRPMSGPEREALVQTALKTPSAIAQAMLVADMFGVDRRAAIGKLDRPVLIIASPRSAELAEQRAMAAKIAGARFEVVPDAAHAVFIDQPQQFDALLRSFLETLPLRGG
jgi:non-heme chloroperoxidase